MTMKALLLGACLLGATETFAQSPLAPNAPEDRPVHFSNTDQHRRLVAAAAPHVEAARKSWPEAKGRYLKGLPPRHVFFITTELVDGAGRREIVFVEVQEIKDGIVTGLIANEISSVSGFHQGQHHSVAEAGIWDWTISKPDGTEEGNRVGKFLETYRPADPVVPEPEKAQLAFLERRGRELATRVRIEAAARGLLEKQGHPMKGLSSPVIVQDRARWLIFFEKGPEVPYKVWQVLECRAEDLGGMRSIEIQPLPKGAEEMAASQLLFKQQLKEVAADMHEIPISDGDRDYSVYLFPRQTNAREITVGRDMKMSFVSGLEKPWVVTTFHQSVHKVNPEDLRKQLPKGAAEPGWIHNHALSDYPTETDVVLAILFPNLRWHVLGKAWHFQIAADGGIRWLPMPRRADPGESR